MHVNPHQRTSRDTGHPKAVSLTHANLAYQINRLDSFLPVRPGERTLSLLPPWHIYERSAAYYVASRGAAAVHSNVRRFRDDLGTYPPDYLVCVPLVLDTLYSRVMAKLKSAGKLLLLCIGTYYYSYMSFCSDGRAAGAGHAVQPGHGQAEICRQIVVGSWPCLPLLCNATNNDVKPADFVPFACCQTMVKVVLV